MSIHRVQYTWHEFFPDGIHLLLLVAFCALSVKYIHAKFLKSKKLQLKAITEQSCHFGDLSSWCALDRFYSYYFPVIYKFGSIFYGHWLGYCVKDLKYSKFHADVFHGYSNMVRYFLDSMWWYSWGI